jgi:tetratricopeptide (TPR) repeat protein
MSLARRLLPLHIVIVLGGGPRLPAAAPPARAWLDSIRLSTYGIGPAQALPQFEAWTKDVANYPYPMLPNLTKQARERTWRTVNLENEYLFCRVLPDLGGHLYSCRDQRNGREVFYNNPVVKPAYVGLRGAWVAMGIESNFPNGHTRANASPVDFAFDTAPDGAARAIVEEIDRVTGMQWHVEFVLRPGNAVLEQRVILYNRGQVRRPYYWWANAAIAFDDPATRLILPAQFVITHAATPEILRWPVDENGKDGAVVANHKGAGAWFAYGTREPFFGVYKPGSRSGVAHFADPQAVAGKKLWLWGSDQDVMVKRDLTDNSSSYIEIQSGVFQDQGKFGFLEPEQSLSFSEYWIPVQDTGGISRVTSDAVLFLHRIPNHMDVELGVTRALPGASIRIATLGRSAYQTKVDLVPGKTWRYGIENPATFPYIVELADSTGAVLLNHTEDLYDTVPSSQVRLGPVRETEPAQGSESGCLESAKRKELLDQRIAALKEIADCLHKFPQSAELKKSAGRLYLSLHRFAEAQPMFETASAAVPSDDEARYGLAIAFSMNRRDADARGILARLAANPLYRRPAALAMAGISARARDDAGALAALGPLLTEKGAPVRAGAFQVALLRRSGELAQAKAAVAQWLTIDPADAMLRFEGTLLDGQDDELWRHLSADSERVLTLVDEYLGLGMEREALVLLDRRFPPAQEEPFDPSVVPVDRNPLIAYYRAYCRARLGEDGSADLRKAAAGYTQFLFPFRASSYLVLASAIKANQQDALAHLLLARLLMNDAQTDQAIAEWRKAAEANPKMLEPRVELARALIDVTKDSAAGRKALKDAIALDPANPSLQEIADRAGVSFNPGAATPPAVGAAPLSPIEAARMALLRAAAGDAGAPALFQPALFTSEKQPDEVRRAYIEVELQGLALMARNGECKAAMDRLFKLGDENPALAFTMYGFGPFMKTAHFDYYAAEVGSACGDEKGARKRWTRVSKMSDPVVSEDFAYPVLAAWRLGPVENRARIAVALERVRGELTRAVAEDRPRLTFSEALLLRASGKEVDAQPRLQQLSQPENGDLWLRFLATVEINKPVAGKK